MKNQSKWKLIEVLPKKTSQYLVMVDDGGYCVAFYSSIFEKWYSNIEDVSTTRFKKWSEIEREENDKLEELLDAFENILTYTGGKLGY